MTTWPTGLLTPLVTPLRDDAVDNEALDRLVESQLAAGVNGIVAGGGTGEFGALGTDERMSITESLITLLDGRVPLIVQTGALATRDSVQLSVAAERAGATGLLLASPFGEPITWRERKRFYEDVADAVSLPIMIYNTPPSGLLAFEQIEELAKIENITAIKDSSGDMTLLGDLLAKARAEDFHVYVGWDSLALPAVARGADGLIIGVANVIAREVTTLLAMRRTSGETDEYAHLAEQLRLFLRFMERSTNYIALCKFGLRLDGLDVGDPRRPYLLPPDDELEHFTGRLQELRSAFSAHAPDATPR
ncbi:dihydrodipicolinate synthase family protein [uncultured Jatrophihabitans sp.]|uniref:dihydrodipicolinate synthase family protein n=1 Tax=uncultured Jatrophihabitans sp. TaxID=1610747 RepID=UPI0035CB06FA